jgi:hypothetical protein
VPCDHRDLKIGKYQLMACNLWTTVSWTGKESYGAHFQRGNNYPFPNKWNIKTSNTQVDASTYWPTNPYYNEILIINSSFIDWSTVPNDDLWWDSTNTDEARQWPCPIGYHVPSTTHLQGLVQAGRTLGLWSGTWNSIQVANFKNILLLPFAGLRLYDRDKVAEQGWLGYYRLSSIYSSIPSVSENLYFTSDNIRTPTSTRRMQVYSVRCFKNS